MKSICIIDYDMSVVGGVEQVTASLANALCDHYEVHLISLCMMQSDKPAYDLDKRIHYVNMLGEESRLSDMKKRIKKPLEEYIELHDIKTVIIQGNYPGFICTSVKTKAKLVFSDHGALMNQWSQKDIVLIRFLASMHCKKVVTLTKQSRDDYRRKFLLPQKKVACIYNWIDTDMIHSESYATDSKRIISAGRFGKEKGFDQLVKVFAKVRDKHPDWKLDIYGDGEMMDEVKKLVDEFSLEGSVNLMGMTSNLASKYKDYAMYVLPSYREGMPLVLLEAKLNRLPIVSFDIMTGPKEIVRDGEDGILVPPYDLDKMADAICKLIEDDVLRCEMSDKSQDNINEFSKEEILKQWIDLIEE